MATSRHKQPKQRSFVRKIAPAAVAAVAAVAIGAVAVDLPADNQGDGSSVTASGESGGTASDTSAADDGARTPEHRTSRSEERKGLPGAPGEAHQPGAGSGKAAEQKSEEPPEPSGRLFATTELNIRTGPGESYDVVTTVSTGTKLPVTDETDGPWAEVVYEGESRWVTAEYLSEDKPEEDETDTSTGGLSDAPCASGSDVESGLTENAITVHRAVCAEFPEVTSYGGLRPGDDGEHGTGQALDIMISGSTGDEIAEFARANASALGVSEVLWSQQIWTVERASEGWRPMEDRGSTTANHYDHVHVTVY
ncbi:SH3 domain-containing protein [Solicola gregarius]|uniref:SH3 domain-containing protein n=1 Tax=Solicola gregarius TaxID=2908642 RepID=A0AA46YJH4_9ACTN|nr:SH3 domain-containing protein [Solicola gregarius]UYM03584.1 SH3 domain-containing protein [Solicola gregarius]